MEVFTNAAYFHILVSFSSTSAVCDEKFYMIGFMSLCELENGQHLPCELGVVEYSLNGGIHRSMHKFIDPGWRY